MKSLKELMDEIQAHPDVANIEVTTWEDVLSMTAYDLDSVNGEKINYELNQKIETKQKELNQ